MEQPITEMKLISLFSVEKKLDNMASFEIFIEIQNATSYFCNKVMGLQKLFVVFKIGMGKCINLIIIINR